MAGSGWFWGPRAGGFAGPGRPDAPRDANNANSKGRKLNPYGGHARNVRNTPPMSAQRKKFLLAGSFVIAFFTFAVYIYAGPYGQTRLEFSLFSQFLAAAIFLVSSVVFLVMLFLTIFVGLKRLVGSTGMRVAAAVVPVAFAIMFVMYGGLAMVSGVKGTFDMSTIDGKQYYSYEVDGKQVDQKAYGPFLMVRE